jgi:hypothetical protein
MNLEGIKKLEELCAAGTPVPWPEPLKNAAVVAERSGGVPQQREIIVRLQYCSPADQALIVAAVNALPELLRLARDCAEMEDT